jgi:hypothetical protein
VTWPRPRTGVGRHAPGSVAFTQERAHQWPSAQTVLKHHDRAGGGGVQGRRNQVADATVLKMSRINAVDIASSHRASCNTNPTSPSRSTRAPVNSDASHTFSSAPARDARSGKTHATRRPLATIHGTAARGGGAVPPAGPHKSLLQLATRTSVRWPAEELGCHTGHRRGVPAPTAGALPTCDPSLQRRVAGQTFGPA